MKLITGRSQMSLIRDSEEVIKFLEFVGRKSILNEHAVNCRLTACHNLFSVLNEDEDNIEYMLTNLDILINRVRNKNTNVTAATLKVYKSRVKSSLEDFRSWSADPFVWERKVTDKARNHGFENKKVRVIRQQKGSPEESKGEEPVAAVPPVEPSKYRKVSFPIRGDFSVEMTLPLEGITQKELQRIGLFLYPYCIDIE